MSCLWINIDKGVFSIISQYLDGRDGARLASMNHLLKHLVETNMDLVALRDIHYIRITTSDNLCALISTNEIPKEISRQAIITQMNAIGWFNHQFNYKLIQLLRWGGTLLQKNIKDYIHGFHKTEGWRCFKTINGGCIFMNDYYGYKPIMHEYLPLFHIYANQFPNTFSWKLIHKPVIKDYNNFYDVFNTAMHRNFSMVLIFKPGCIPDPNININKYLSKKPAVLPPHIIIGPTKKRKFVDIPVEFTVCKEQKFYDKINELSSN